jgi:hypothetical protein
VNPVDELAALLPPAPASQELPGRAQHKAYVLAAMTTRRAAGGPLHLLPQHPLPHHLLPQHLLPLRRARRWLLAGASAVAVVAVALLAVLVPRLAAGPAQQGAQAGAQLTTTRQWTVPAAGLSGVTVLTTSGQVTVTGGTSTSAAITALPTYHGIAPVLTSRVADGTLTIAASCPPEPSCRVSITVVMPTDLAVHAAAQQGDVRLTGLAGNAVASTDQGDVTLSQLSGQVTATVQQGDVSLTAVTGPVAARTGQGNISAVGLAAPTAALSTDQGDVHALFWVAPRLVIASSQEGSVSLSLPSTVTYQVSASTQLGSRSVSVPESPGSAHVIRASTQVGSVTVTG